MTRRRRWRGGGAARWRGRGGGDGEAVEEECGDVSRIYGRLPSPSTPRPRRPRAGRRRHRRPLLPIPPRGGQRDLLAAGLIAPPTPGLPGPSPADAFEERGDAIFLRLSPRRQYAFRGCVVCWRTSRACTVRWDEAKMLLPYLLKSVLI